MQWLLEVLLEIVFEISFEIAFELIKLLFRLASVLFDGVLSILDMTGRVVLYPLRLTHNARLDGWCMCAGFVVWGAVLFAGLRFLGAHPELLASRQLSLTRL